MNTILLVPQADMIIVKEVAATASDIRVNTIPRQELGRKRFAIDAISERHHIREKQVVYKSSPAALINNQPYELQQIAVDISVCLGDIITAW
jgi:hypothetical protein